MTEGLALRAVRTAPGVRRAMLSSKSCADFTQVVRSLVWIPAAVPAGTSTSISTVCVAPAASVAGIRLGTNTTFAPVWVGFPATAAPLIFVVPGL